MRVFYSEFRAVYETYTFGYSVYAAADSQDEIPAIYAKGFLPYSARYDLPEPVFYLARSVRIDLERFTDTSENRRVDRKMAALSPTLEMHALANFDTNNADFRAFCRLYAEERFKGGAMGDTRLDYLLTRSLLNTIFTIRSGDQLLGYVFAVVSNSILHYWYSFFDTKYLHSHSLGKWLMWRVLAWAKEQGLQYAYLGTCYRSGGLYKVRDHRGASFWDGMEWNTDTNLLKQLCARDELASPPNSDLFQDSQFMEMLPWPAGNATTSHS